MPPNPFASVPMDQLAGSGTIPPVGWLWHGYVARGNLTLLTSLWKAGKTTLLAGLLQRLGTGGTFLGRGCEPAEALVVSEESPELWAERMRTIPIGPHARLMARPFLTRPTPAAWADLIGHALDLRAAGQLDLFVIDPLASFLPGRSDCDVGTLLDMLHPLQRLAAAGTAVLILHHPRKEPAEEGNAARGGGALLGFVDIILEVYRVGGLPCDERRRRLIGLSRHAQTPRRLVYEWVAGEFLCVDDPHEKRHRENWEQVRMILAGRTSAATHQELLMDWPAGRPIAAGGQRALRMAEPGACGEADPPRGRRPAMRPVPLPAGERGRRLPGARGARAAVAVAVDAGGDGGGTQSLAGAARSGLRQGEFGLLYWRYLHIEEAGR